MGIKSTFRKVISDLISWANEPSEARYEDSPALVSSRKSRGINTVSASNNIEDGNNGMNFTVYNATGGKVVQIRTYDPRTDRSTSALYIVADKEDLGEELAQIITRESLTR